MRSLPCAAATALLACSLAASAEPRTPCSQSVAHPFPARAFLDIDSKPAGLRIVPTDTDELKVSCTAENEDTAADVRLRFSPTAHGGKLSIEGHHAHRGNNNLEVKIEVPRRTSLHVRMFAGQITIDGVKGDKDLSIGAGQITISPIHEGDYRTVNASVTIGEVQASAFGVDKGGFFRSIKRSSPTGDYRLEAHVTTGQIELLGNAAPTAAPSKPD